MNTGSLTTPRLLLASMALVVAGASGIVAEAAPATAATLCLQHNGKFASCQTGAAPAPIQTPSHHRAAVHVSPVSHSRLRIEPTVQATSTGIAPVHTVALAGVGVLVGAVLLAEGLVAVTLRRRSQSVRATATYSNLQIQ